MDKKLFDMVHEQMPKFNPLLANGLAVYQVPMAEAFIDRVFTCISKGFPPCVVYEGYSRCTPQEDYNEATAKRGSKRYFEIARKNIYLVKYKFSYIDPNGVKKPLYPRYLYLPFVEDGGIFAMRGARYIISPVIADRILSIDQNSMFIVLNCAKLKFEDVIHHYIQDGSVYTAKVPWAPVHNEYKKKKGKRRSSVDACTSLFHYLFCRYGVINTFKQFFHADVVLGENEINETNYPRDKWTICGSAGIKPARLKDKAYRPSNIRLAIKTADVNYVTQSCIGGLFYILDHFPDRFQPEYFGTEDELTLWKILLGHMIFPSNSSEGDLCNKIEDHLSSLDEYIDEMDQENLKKIGINVDNVYQLFVEVIETMATRLLEVGSNVSSLYGKQLNILRYLLYDLRAAMSNVRYKLRKNNSKRPLTMDDVVKIMNEQLPREIIESVIKGTEHGEVSSISCPGDNKILKISTCVLMQTKSGSSQKRKPKNNLNDPSKRLHASLVEVGSICNLPQSDPTGQSRLNLMVQIDDEGEIVRNPEFIPLLDTVQAMIER